ncbi:MAG: DUF2169 family type VI secretion system accessory protein [Candidatus Latescibacterota bacterium]
MRYVNLTPFPGAYIAGRLNFPGHSVTLLVKGTFDLRPGQASEPSKEQPFPTGDEYYPDDDEQKGGPRYEYDFAYFKPRTDLLLAGRCWSAGGKPVPASRVTFRVGPHARSLYVYGDRFWKGPSGLRAISNPVPFTSRELRYENSFGGPGYENNPVGKGYAETVNQAGERVWPLPNIEDPDHLIDSPDNRPAPAGFGPLGRMWKQRASRMGSYGGDWKNTRWPWFPRDFDWSHFNAAPPGMQVEGYLRGDEPLFFENLHPKYPRYESRLPGLRVRVFLNRLVAPDSGEMKFSEVPLRLDTLWADMDNEKLALIWRGSAEVLNEEMEEIRHVFIMSESLASEPASLQRCSEMYLAALAKEEEGFAAEMEKPAAPAAAAAEIAVPGIAAAIPGIAAAETAEEEAPPESEEIPPLDPDTIKSQAKSFMAKAGINVENLPPEVRDRMDREMDKAISRMVEKDPAKLYEQQQADMKAQLAAAFSKLGLDADNPPPVSGKARQEQIRMMKEMGLENPETVFQDPEISRIMDTLMAIYPKIGIDPENLSPFIERAKPQFDQIKKSMAGYVNPSGGKSDQSTEKKQS